MIDHILGHKTFLSKFKMIEIIQSVFTDYSDMKLEINIRMNTGKLMNTWKLNSPHQPIGSEKKLKGK